MFLSIGWFFVALGAIGLLLPIMPTTPFLILAAYCFKRGSDQLYQWLLRQPYLGKGVRDWDEHHVIRPPAKILSCVMVCGGMSYPIFFKDNPVYLKVMLGVIAFLVCGFILSRKSYPEKSKQTSQTEVTNQ